MRALYLIGCLVSLMLPSFAFAQNIWPTTQIDEQFTVQMPYEGTLEEEQEFPGVQHFWTETSDNKFQVLRIDLRYTPGYNPSSKPTEAELSKGYNKLGKLYNRQIIKGTLLSQRDITFAGGLARAALYRGVHEYRQEPIHIEAMWLRRGHAVYLITCSYAIPEEEEAIADKNQFFNSLHFTELTSK